MRSNRQTDQLTRVHCIDLPVFGVSIKQRTVKELGEPTAHHKVKVLKLLLFKV